MNHKALPRGYLYVATLDFSRCRDQMMAVLKLSLAALGLFLLLGLLISPPRISWRGFLENWYLWAAMIGMQAAYIPLHELTHGIAMYALSGVRPSYGIRLPYAWCGSTAWLDRRSHILTALVPVIFWGIALQAAIHLLPGRWFWPLWLVQLSNLSGSTGDVYCVFCLLRMKGDLLIQDTGTRMRIYRKTLNPVEEREI